MSNLYKQEWYKNIDERNVPTHVKKIMMDVVQRGHQTIAIALGGIELTYLRGIQHPEKDDAKGESE